MDRRSPRHGRLVLQVTPEQWPSISRLLDEALELQPEERAEWLESLPPADHQFKGKLRALLRHAVSAETRAFHDIFPNLPLDTVRSIRYLRSGDKVGPYIIEEEI